MPAILSLLLCAGAVSSHTGTLDSVDDGPVDLWIIPHTHADVGWLQTVDSLARMNVSRILSGVVANLQNGSVAGRRRFVWDEMAFLDAWWKDERTSDAEREAFKAQVLKGQIELADNGWSQHDMGATTLDGMLSNWQQGHDWLRNEGLPMPKIGWSLDPFGLSGSQAVLQALMGFDAWFFTRVGNDRVAQGKTDKSIEFLWRASSSDLPETKTEIFAHIFESYYCMPLPTYAFEWGPPRSAPGPPWNDTQRMQLARGLANITLERAPWFRSRNVLIPWGCDYQFQNAALVYDATDILIDTINANTAGWGVRARYGTPSEYLAALQAADIELPVMNGGDFFPYVPNDKQGAWSGYFTSRPILKRLSRVAEGALHAAETLFVRRAGGAGKAERADLWSALDMSRKNCGIVQHHDAITGTECRKQEGCSGTGQLVGSHDVLGDYESMLRDAASESNGALAKILAQGEPTALDADITVLGNALLSGRSGSLVVHNPLATTRKAAAVNIPLPICGVSIVDSATNKVVVSQVTGEIDIPSINAPFYDYEVAFLADFGPFESRAFTVRPSIDGCSGEDFVSSDNEVLGIDAGKANTAVRHRVAHRVRSPLISQDDRIEREFWDCSLAGEGLGSLDVCRHLRDQRLMGGGAPDQLKSDKAQPAPEAPEQNFSFDNDFLTVYFDPRVGIVAVYDKKSSANYSLTHQIVAYTSKNSDAYRFEPTGDARVVGIDIDGGAVGGASLTTVARGPVMSEARFQYSHEIKTFFRVYNSPDPSVGGRIEVVNEIGVLNATTEVSSRFELAEAKKQTKLITEDNGYEKISRVYNGTVFGGKPNLVIPANYFPSQMSAAIFGDEGVQLSVALDRAKGVATLAPGQLEIMHHRRVTPYAGVGSTVVLDDTDRIHTSTWVSVGPKTDSNRQRLRMRDDLNRPLIALAADGAQDAAAHVQRAAKLQQTSTDLLPQNVRLQSVRALVTNASLVLVRLQHTFAPGDDPDLSVAACVDVGALVDAILGGNSDKVQDMTEVTLDAGMPVGDVKRLQWNTTDDSKPQQLAGRAAAIDCKGQYKFVLQPFEIKALLVEIA